MPFELWIVQFLNSQIICQLTEFRKSKKELNCILNLIIALVASLRAMSRGILFFSLDGASTSVSSDRFLQGDWMILLHVFRTFFTPARDPQDPKNRH